MDKELEQTLLQRRHTAVQQVKEMDIKITMRYNFIRIRMAIVKKKKKKKKKKKEKKKKKKQKITTVSKDVDKFELLRVAGGNVNWGSHYGKWYSSSSEN